ncbi:hypothetical protein H4R99_001424 [Coemansia sp. RSA 1722]|nr:hypothetical protein LPJ57_000882 [Coemansia sp. RSA 486]KAJ2236778.1 hypothetical protein IWW45_001516 [Coemansia sp. RSA 485]KAJ2601656.1 hypothetical protein GGF39_001136 [Coemansia sp. RSA 1721]KAJ2605021.1 hypothetical protein H4R99_001424 [Coemansia sp. RSA 1722]KAJ2638936.1 hypothetical protein GGF40_001267 [Coemansia sp. RSA 1286]
MESDKISLVFNNQVVRIDKQTYPTLDSLKRYLVSIHRTKSNAFNMFVGYMVTTGKPLTDDFYKELHKGTAKIAIAYTLPDDSKDDLSKLPVAQKIKLIEANNTNEVKNSIAETNVVETTKCGCDAGNGKENKCKEMESKD